MPCVFLGLQHVSFKDRTTGKTVSGVSVYIAFDLDSEYGFGQKAEKFFLSEDTFSKFSHILTKNAVMSPIYVYFNSSGKIYSIAEAE